MLAGLAILTYLPSVFLPFISDDYVHIAVARQFVPVSGWDDLARDPVYRCRATSHFLTYRTEQWFGLDPVAFSWSSVLLHVLNTLLVFALGSWRAVGWRAPAVAAGFFAVYEGHQEAVVWYAALPELLVFFFSLVVILFWIARLRNHQKRVSLYAAALLAFVLAMLSKESGVIVVALTWVANAFIPYSFLSDMPRVPSRHTYLASLGLSLVVAKGLLCLYRHFRGSHYQWVVYAVAFVILAHNLGYLWTKKQAQYEERAAPAEALIDMVKESNGPVYVHCFPYGEEIARKAVEVGAGRSPYRVVWDPAPPDACESGFSLSWNPDQDVRQNGKRDKREPAAQGGEVTELIGSR